MMMVVFIFISRMMLLVREVDDNGNMIGAIEFESTKRFYIVVEFTHLVKEELR